MDLNAFWHLIAESRCQTSTFEGQAEYLLRSLLALGEAEVLSFDACFSQVYWRAYRADLWDVVALVDGGCGDDGFDYFRGWLIAQGKACYDEVLADPQRITKYSQSECDTQYPEILSVADRAYRHLTGGREVPTSPSDLPQLQGQLSDEVELPSKYPRVWEALKNRH